MFQLIHRLHDVLTKALPNEKFHFFVPRLNLVSSPQFSLRRDVRVPNDSVQYVQYTSDKRRPADEELDHVQPYTGLVVCDQALHQRSRATVKLDRKKVNLGS
jgi:hypothetical protein